MENNFCKFCKETMENCKCKKWIGKILMVVAFLLVVFAGVVFAIKTYTNSTNPRSIVVTGTGEVSAVPDVSTINFTLRSSNVTGDTKSLQDEVAKSADSVIAKLKSLGIDSKDIKTNNYSVNPRYGYQDCSKISSIKPCDSNVIVGYEASENISVKVRDIQNVSKVLDVLATDKITEVSGPSFEVDDMDKLKNEARDIAIQNAKEKAGSLGKSLGVKIKTIISFSDDTGSYTPMPMMYKTMSADSMMGGVAREANIQAGEQKITSNVSITFQIED